MTSIRRPGLLAWLHLMRVYHKMQQHSSSHLHCYDLTSAQFEVLAHLSVNPGMTQQELADKLLVTKGNVCGLINRLETDGLVERCSDPDDKRSNRLHLTEKGGKLAAEAIPEHEAFVAEHMSVLSGDDLESLHMLLRDLDQSLKQHQH
jgi:DNA-binding MarR family transcriptional regulator